MALPDAPQTRSEQYLNAIATGSTSGIPATPQTRMEQYLDVIANNGGGGGGGGVLVVTATDGALDKTFAEIKAAYDAGMVCILKSADEPTVSYFTGYETPNARNPNYIVTFVFPTGSNFVDNYISATENGVLLEELGSL